MNWKVMKIVKPFLLWLRFPCIPQWRKDKAI